MPALYSLDSLFEYRLYPTPLNLDSSLKRRNRCLEKMFFPVTRPEDFVLVEELPSDELYSHWKEVRLTPGTPVQEGDLLGEVTLVEWGCRNEWYEGKLLEDPIRTETSRYLNSKITQLDFRKHHSPLPAKVISSEEHLFAELEEAKLPIVLKSEFGLAGRNHIIFKSRSDSWKMSQVNKNFLVFPSLQSPGSATKGFLIFLLFGMYVMVSSFILLPQPCSLIRTECFVGFELVDRSFLTPNLFFHL